MQTIFFSDNETPYMYDVAKQNSQTEVLETMKITKYLMRRVIRQRFLGGLDKSIACFLTIFVHFYFDMIPFALSP